MMFRKHFRPWAIAAVLAAASVAPGIAATQDQARTLPFTATLEPAPAIELYDSELETSDSNSPVHWANGRVYVFVSHWLPIGHSYRRAGTSLDALEDGAISVVIEHDRTQGVGKWIEATYRDPDGTLFGWYHAETAGPCGREDAKVPVIGALASRDGGITWNDLGAVIEAPSDAYDCDMQNGFFAGGLGDFSVIVDRGHRFFYFLFSNYDRHRSEQGIAVARMPYAARENPRGQVRKWRDGTWSEPGLGGQASPIFPAVRNFRHPDPDSFWGPAISYNTYLGGYVMALNHTAEGEADWFQEGIYLSFAKDLADPGSWAEPEKLMDGGDWYPQIIGMAPGETDKLSGERGRFFMSGYSVWEIEFHKRGANTQAGGATGSIIR
jgi:hypothetical protein